MLQEKEQVSFIDMFRPPSGFRLDACLGTTFSLDLECLVQLALSARGVRDEVELARETGFEIVQDFSERSVIFVQSCRIKEIPRSLLEAGDTQRSRFIRLMDDCLEVVPVDESLKAFHPKVWVLSFRDESTGTQILRLAIMSRNLTKSQNWDISIMSEGAVGEAAKNEKSNDLIEFCKMLGKDCNIKEKSKAGRIIQQVVSEIQRTDFKYSKEIRQVAHSYQWGKKKIWSLGFREREGRALLDIADIRRLIVVSPFLHPGEIDRIARVKSVTVITTDVGLSALSSTKNIASSPVEFLRFDMQDVDLHAKIYLVETRSGKSYVILGSANCTKAGLSGGNVEFMSKLIMDRNACESFQNDFIYKDPRKKELNNWLMPVDNSKLANALESTESELTVEKFDQIRQAISGIEFSLRYSAQNAKLEVTADGKVEIPKGFECKIIVFGFNDEFHLRDILVKPGIISPVKLAQCSRFLLITIRSAGNNEALSFCTLARSNFDRDSRRKALLASVILDADFFFSYLNSLLDLEPMGELDERNIPKGTEKDLQYQVPKGLAPGILENLLLNVSSNPETLKKIDLALVSARSNAGSDIRLSEFESLWTMLKNAIAETK